MSDSSADCRSPLGLFATQACTKYLRLRGGALRCRHYSRHTDEAYLHWTAASRFTTVDTVALDRPGPVLSRSA
jgi:hypothetical protein